MIPIRDVVTDYAPDPVTEAMRGPVPCVCNACGERFASKGERRRHSSECFGDEWGRICASLDRHAAEARAKRPDLAKLFDDDWNCGGSSHASPEIAARAAAEWHAMDSRGATA